MTILHSISEKKISSTREFFGKYVGLVSPSAQSYITDLYLSLTIAIDRLLGRAMVEELPDGEHESDGKEKI
ncbi:hypothetical protein FACS189449_10020 [Alphaproteobacteria bacterium]|nr:hypothetical protein FACS189449_10020 [Alphaproteobacteria bacterium]